MGGWYSHTTITLQEYSVLKVSTRQHVKKPNLEENKVYISVPKSLPLCILQLCTVFNKSYILAKIIQLGSCVLIKHMEEVFEFSRMYGQLFNNVTVFTIDMVRPDVM